MPQPLPMPLRQQIWNRFFLQHQSAAAIAEALHLKPRTVQYLLDRFRRQGSEALRPSYGAAARATLPPHPLRDEALFLHQEHSSWGAGFLRLILEDRHPGQLLPSARTLQRWFHIIDHDPAPPGRKPHAERQPAQRPHDVWQVDAADQKRLLGGRQISWLRYVDEFSGAVLGTTVFPPRDLLRSAAVPGTGGFPAAVLPLGFAGAVPLRQRQSLGQLE
jgi:hypothetical protein